ncbi:hypothetical protein Tco_0992223 [Tanacetum coccineum]|uniref:Uncharacterized protein n=1 Tax=Tanacetum coccineum TaxID=301880 RepID=A0ABQ5F2K6_9ASTR
MSMMGEMTFFLSLQVNQSPPWNLHKPVNYVLEILKKYEMETCDPVGTPMEIKDQDYLIKNRLSQPRSTSRRLKGSFRLISRGTVNNGSFGKQDSGIKQRGFFRCYYAGLLKIDASKTGTSVELKFLDGEKLVAGPQRNKTVLALSIAEAEYVSLSA